MPVRRVSITLAASASALAAVPGGGTIGAATGQVTPTRIVVANGEAVLVMGADGTRRSSHLARSLIGGDVTLSRDRRTAAYASLSGIRLLDVASKTTRRLRTPRGISIDPIFARQSSTLYFLRSRSGMNVRYDLWSISLPSGKLMRYTRKADLQMIDVSPDERGIAYVRDFSEAGGRIYVAKRDGSRARMVARGFNPAFSPDGRLLAYSASDGIRVVPVAGGKTRVVVSGGDHPVFSPDGKRLAFVDASRCIDHAYCLERVFVASVAGGGARPIGPELANPGRLAWR